MKYTLRDRFLVAASTLIGSIRRDIGEAEKLYNYVIAEYTSPNRHYHTVSHLEHMFSQLDSRTQKRLPEWDLAVFLHDLILIPGAKDNEVKSAIKFYDLFAPYNTVSENLERRVTSLILATQLDHYKYNILPLFGSPEMRAEQYNTKLFCDADMSILAADPEVYKDYVAKVRLEYSYLSDTTWQNGRKAFLQRILSRGSIYLSEEFSDCEDLARENMTSELMLYM